MVEEVSCGATTAPPLGSCTTGSITEGASAAGVQGAATSTEAATGGAVGVPSSVAGSGNGATVVAAVGLCQSVAKPETAIHDCMLELGWAAGHGIQDNHELISIGRQASGLTQLQEKKGIGRNSCCRNFSEA